jgi:hypothetical protein
MTVLFKRPYKVAFTDRKNAAIVLMRNTATSFKLKAASRKPKANTEYSCKLKAASLKPKANTEYSCTLQAASKYKYSLKPKTNTEPSTSSPLRTVYILFLYITNMGYI